MSWAPSCCLRPQRTHSRAELRPKLGNRARDEVIGGTQNISYAWPIPEGSSRLSRHRTCLPASCCSRGSPGQEGLKPPVSQSSTLFLGRGFLNCSSQQESQPVQWPCFGGGVLGSVQLLFVGGFPPPCPFLGFRTTLGAFSTLIVALR